MKGKILLCALAAIVVVTYIINAAVGNDATTLAESKYIRVFYMFCHGGLLHLAANVMCLIAIARSDFRVPPHFILMAIVVAMCAPMNDNAVTMGCSGVCYALLGAMSWQSIDVKRYHMLIALFLTIGLMPWLHVNNMLHAFCYIEGVMFGWLCKD